MQLWCCCERAGEGHHHAAHWYAFGQDRLANIYTQLNKSAVQLHRQVWLQPREQGAVVIAWGSFLTAVLTFVVVSFVLFLVVKGVAAAKTAITKPTEGEVTEKTCPFCQMKFS